MQNPPRPQSASGPVEAHGAQYRRSGKASSNANRQAPARHSSQPPQTSTIWQVPGLRSQVPAETSHLASGGQSASPLHPGRHARTPSTVEHLSPTGHSALDRHVGTHSGKPVTGSRLQTFPAGQEPSVAHLDMGRHSPFTQRSPSGQVLSDRQLGTHSKAASQANPVSQPDCLATQAAIAGSQSWSRPWVHSAVLAQGWRVSGVHCTREAHPLSGTHWPCTQAAPPGQFTEALQALPQNLRPSSLRMQRFPAPQSSSRSQGPQNGRRGEQTLVATSHH